MAMCLHCNKFSKFKDSLCLLIILCVLHLHSHFADGKIAVQKVKHPGSDGKLAMSVIGMLSLKPSSSSFLILPISALKYFCLKEKKCLKLPK